MDEFDKAAAQVAGKEKDPFDAAASQVVQSDRTALRSSLYNSLLENPDMAARAVQLGRKTGLPADVVQRNMPEVQRNVQLDEFDKVLQNSPTVAKWLTEQNNAAIAHDDADNLTALDGALKFFSNTGSAAKSGLLRASAGVVGVAQAPFDLGASLLDPLVGTILPANPMRAPANVLSKYRQTIEEQAKAAMPKGDGNLESGFYSGIGSLANNAMALPLAFLPGGQRNALMAMVAPVAGGEYGKARDAGLNPLAALSFGASQGLVEYATERLPLAKLIGDVKVGTPFFKTLAKQAALEVPGEQVATALQDLNEWAALNPDKPFSSYIAERPDAAVQTLVATLVGVGGQVTVAKGIETAVQRIAQQGDKVQEAERNAQVFEQLDKLAAASKVRGRDADTFEAFVSQVAEETGAKNIYIDANVLNQSDILDAILEASPSVREQFTAALATGGEIQIPLAEYTARIAGTEISQNLIDDIRIEGEQFTRRSAQEYMQTQATALEEEVARVVAQQEQADEFKANIDEVKAQVKAQLDQVGRFTGNVNDAYATLMGNFFGVMANKLGVKPQELYARYTPKFQAESVVGGQVLEQNNRSAQGKRDDYTVDVFGIPAQTDTQPGPAGPDTAGLSGNVDTTGPVSRDDAQGIFATRTKLVKETEKTIGIDQVKTAQDAATALAYLARGAVERFDALVTDKDGKPLAVVGSFKGKVNATAVYASTIIGEAFRIPNAANIWMAHNHPSGEAALSPADLNLTGSLARAFEGSDIKFNGVFAIGAGNGPVREYTLTKNGTTTDERGTTVTPTQTTKVPVLERVIDEFGKLGPGFNSPAVARRVTSQIANGESGVVLLDSQNAPIAFVPLKADELAPLRQDGRMDALYRAVSMANAAGAIFVRNDAAYTDKGIKNVGALLNSLDLRVLDVVDKKGNTYESWAETGQQLATSDFFQKRNNAPRGSFNPATNTITLLKNADLSTFLHEAGHFFLEVQFDIAARLQQEAALFGAESNKPGETQLLRDTNAILEWFGIRDLNEWNSLDFEEKRSHHERFARGFEAYLFEGRAPSIEMQKVFQTFRNWLTSVYRSLIEAARKALGAKASDSQAIGKALDVELNPEVRAVFDRMLATEDQIQLAEQNRSMVPLLTAPEQTGMTVDEFEAYQALGQEATDTAVQDVQARTLRDLAWSRNARGREIKRLQKQAAEARRQVQIDVRREVMSQPVYRAWAFLTSKLGADDKLQPLARPKSDPNVLDETQDTLFEAIAKLGGLDREEVIKTWGTDPADKPNSGLFGKPVWRKEKGRSIDAMAEVLGEAGYLTRDENGKVDLAEFEARFDSELRGSPQYSLNYVPQYEPRAGDQVANPQGLTAGRLDDAALTELGLPAEIDQRIRSLKMTAKTGLHPDMVAEMFGFTSGDELVRTLAATNPPTDEIEGLTDARMLEQYGELATPEAIEVAADKAIHNEARARFVATEANALAKATGQPKILAKAAKAFADQMVARLKVRAIRPGQYTNAEARAARAAAKASQAGDLATAAAEKRNQLVNVYAAKAAYSAQDEIERGLRYFKKFDSEGTRKGLDADYTDQIDALLERFDLRTGQSLKAIDKRTALAAWVESQRDQGLEPDIPADLLNEATRKSYKDMTVEEFRGLVDSVKQIEHLGRLKNKLLTAADNRAFNEVREIITKSIEDNAGDRVANTRTPTTKLDQWFNGVEKFWASHIKAATWARVMDGGKDGGPVWEYIIRPANERADMETTMRAQATEALAKILDPVLKMGGMGGKGQFFPEIGRSLNRQERLAIALNTGNAGNLQRLLGGEGWALDQILPVLRTLSIQEWATVQAVWDHFESYRPQIAAKERRVYGKEPNWVEPGSAVTEAFGIKGGYYPIKYDPMASQQAEQFDDAEAAKRQLQGAFTSATTRRSFTKNRAEEVTGRPLLYSLAGVYSGVNDVIHDLAWHEWLIDTNRLLRSKSIDTAIRTKYGPAAKQQLKQWAADIAEGDKGAQNAGEAFLGRLRQGVSAAGLGFNLMSAAIQITGFNQSLVRVGPRWIGKGIAQYMASPIESARAVVDASPFMADRARTQLRELAELRNRVEGGNGLLETVQRNSYWLMARVQKMVDVPTWLGAYEKAMAEGNDEDRAVALADQAVRDSQGSGLTSDLSGIERGTPALKLFTVFYAYMNTAFNLGVAQTMTAKSKAKLAVDYLMIFTVPAVLGAVLKDALTPGDGDDDEELARKLAAEQLSYLMGTMFGVREFSAAAKIVVGAPGASRDYDGPAGLRLITESYGLLTQVAQGEFDDAFRKSAVNVLGALMGLPAAQINRTITGAQALADDKTDNPAALLFGYQE